MGLLIYVATILQAALLKKFSYFRDVLPKYYAIISEVCSKKIHQRP